MSEMKQVFCSGCGCLIGFASEKYPNRVKVFCDKRCAIEPPITAETERNDQWQYLHMAHEYKPVALGHMYGSPHGLVYKTLDRLARPLEEQPADWS